MPKPESVPRVKGDPRATELLGVVRETLGELRRHPVAAMRITLDSSLDRDLGLDSLARVEPDAGWIPAAGVPGRSATSGSSA